MANPSQEFTAKTLKWMRRWKSQSHLLPSSGSYPTLEHEWIGLLSQVADKIRTDNFTFSNLYSTLIKGKVAVTTRNLEECLVLRKLNDNIRRCYGLRQPNRQHLVQTVKQALREKTPKTVIRLDIKSCFESIDRKAILSQFSTDGHLTFQTTALLENVFAACANLTPEVTKRGLPRGIVVSTTMAEVRLQDIDRLIRQVPGVYLLLRYVDDILVFSTDGPAESKREIVKAINSLGLQVNNSKSKVARVACKCEKVCSHSGGCPCASKCKCAKTHPNNVNFFEYLGYKFIFSAHNNTEGPNEVFCMLSDRKIAKIKSRIYLAFASFKSTSDVGLLQKRMRYLSGNQTIFSSPNKRSLLNGLSFTHAEYSPPSDPLQHKLNSIAELDRFYRGLLRRNASAVSPSDLVALEKISFTSGFTLIRRTKFSVAEMLRIKECWQNE